MDLRATGHTHGGQFYPFALAVAAGKPALSGWHRFVPAQLFIGNGAGSWAPPDGPAGRRAGRQRADGPPSGASRPTER